MKAAMQQSAVASETETVILVFLVNDLESKLKPGLNFEI
jgi:hypothetical protein